MTNKKTAICIARCGEVKPGMTVSYEMYESYGNEWITVFVDDISKQMSIETFQKKFKKI